jgi:hypothetical protein
MEIRSHAPCLSATTQQVATPPQDRPGPAQSAGGMQVPCLLTQWGEALQSPAPMERAMAATIFTGIGP